MTNQRDSGFCLQISCGVLGLIALFLCGISIIFGQIQADHFWDEGIRVEGIVLTVDVETEAIRSSLGTKRGERFVSESIQFEYLVKGQAFRHRQVFHYDTPLFIGQIIPVIYLPKTPWVAEILLDAPEDHTVLIVISLGGAIFIGISLVLFSLISPRKQKRKPHQEGLYDQTTL